MKRVKNWLLATVVGMTCAVLWMITSMPLAASESEVSYGDTGVGVDWVADLAIGVASEDLAGSSTFTNAGGVHVLYGSGSGPTTSGDDWWTQAVPGVGEVDSYERFGNDLAAGDFNGDGRTDLAIGAPGEDADGVNESGAVFIFYAGDDGLNITDLFVLHQNTSGMPDTAAATDFFGSTLVSGDFNKDGYDDLAICARLKGFGATFGAGAVYVVFGSPAGISTEHVPQFIHQDLSGLYGSAEINNYFGEVMATGDFNGDGHDDLVIGVPSQNNVGGIIVSDAGAAYVLYGQYYGLRTSSSLFVNQDTIGVDGMREMNDHFGAALTTGDFNGDGYDDIALGAPDEDWSTDSDAGAIHIFQGSDLGITTTDEFMWDQTDAGGFAMPDELFGRALTSADFDGDGYDDLAIGAPGELSGSGSVSVVYGSSSGLGYGELWRQGTYSSLFDEAENGDFFGDELVAGDLDGDGYDDLVVGVPFEDFGSTIDVGVLHVIFGTVNGLTNIGDLYFHQLYSGIGGDGPEASDYFGRNLEVISRRELIFRDGFESNSTYLWD